MAVSGIDQKEQKKEKTGRRFERAGCVVWRLHFPRCNRNLMLFSASKLDQGNKQVWVIGVKKQASWISIFSSSLLGFKNKNMVGGK